ncbi:MAG: N-acetylmuramoyl-L-alanine amidase [Actinomycetales bacterium]
MRQSRPTRRAVLVGLAGLTGVTGAGPASSSPAIRPRQDWAQGLGPTGPLEPEDSRFLIVHHSDTGNGYPAERVGELLAGMYRYHVSPEKGWPDIAYNFLVDAYGTIWEGRTGSLAGPVRGDATGGSQGFAQLCCFIGSHASTAPTAAAQQAMSALLAWLAARDGIDLRAGHTISFVSRGSNRWPGGQTVVTDPVVGHRDMSRTSCPGDACYPLVSGALLLAAQNLSPNGAGSASGQAQAGDAPPAPSTQAVPQPGPSDPAQSESAQSESAQPEPAQDESAQPESAQSEPAQAEPAQDAGADAPTDPGRAGAVLAAGGLAAVAAGGALVAVRRRSRPGERDEG